MTFDSRQQIDLPLLPRDRYIQIRPWHVVVVPAGDGKLVAEFRRDIELVRNIGLIGVVFDLKIVPRDDVRLSVQL